ncbi:4Fe-4S dicluster domain-containing protein [Acetobacterium paludosum]|uniref:4Fe-4S dicluster domain-containing protein n=1 Tax=Acetobacterium paludosum TaxID=52693 RepID=A0A923KVI3_9FIRM|nr:4Fe-4S binding protein [Acetobacterium paludosum]MBC3887028.1 4Fe-4S dicluster domain-containing protein [Acetobacterium paludosum]
MITQNEITALKAQGILAQQQEGYFSFRVLSRAGNLTSEEFRSLANIAEKYGRGYLGETTRLAIEIPWIKYADIEAVKAALVSDGLTHGGTGKKVRPLVACKGTVCLHGLYDTQKLCGECHDRFFGQELHSKTKLTFVGCPNNCAKANTNDIGFVGQAYVQYDSDACKHCGKCTKVCRAKALTMVDKKLVWDEKKCVNCGECAKVCPAEAMTEEVRGIAIYLGGRMGRGYRFGDRLTDLYAVAEIPDLIEKIFETYTDLGVDGERISAVIDRIGINAFEDALLERLEN